MVSVIFHFFICSHPKLWKVGSFFFFWFVFFEKQQNLHTQSGKHGYANTVLSTCTVISQSINQADCNLACDTLDSLPGPLVTVGAVQQRAQKLCEFSPVKMFSTLPLLVLISTIGNYFLMTCFILCFMVLQVKSYELRIKFFL